MGAGILGIAKVNVGSEAMPDFYSLMKNEKNGESKYAGKGSVEVH